MTDTQIPVIGADDFTRRFSVRAKALMWFMGAGTSASAGIPTAWDMIWEFKQQLFVSRNRVSPQTVSDLSSPSVRRQLQAYIDGAEHFPPSGSPEEYAALFEAVYPVEKDRRIYIDSKISGAKPSYGHMVLATFMRAELTRIIWTTNFDRLVADACANVFGGTGRLSTATLDAPDLARQTIDEERWPIEIKLHGDFQSRRLKNTGDELRHQDAQLRRGLVDCCRRYGLIVVGYSGRDDSVMDTFETVLNEEGGFPSGLFWLKRGDDPLLPRVEQFLGRALKSGVETALIRIENFDEVMRDLLRLTKDMDTKEVDAFAAERRRWTPAPRPNLHHRWPVVRLNALPVQSPSVCRVVNCEIGGYDEVREAVANAGVDVIVARSKAGILAYGSDEALRIAFGKYEITGFDLHTIEKKRLRYDSNERGLLRSALTRAIARECGLDSFRRRNSDLLAPTDPKDLLWRQLQRCVGNLAGNVIGHPELTWREGIATRLDWADDQLWLLYEPRTVFNGVTNQNKAFAASFARERTIKRYNRQLNELIDIWAGILAREEKELRSIGIGDGVDAVFRLSPITAFSRRA